MLGSIDNNNYGSPGPGDGLPPVVDGFLYSASLLYLPTTYRASIYAQMEVLRRARGYRVRWYLTPEDVQQPIPAYSQVEYQIQSQPGAYLWGLSLSAPDELNETENSEQFITVQVTDACTETPLFSDYVNGNNLKPVTGPGRRHPFMPGQPLLIGQPGTVNVEVYNAAANDVHAQLVLFIAEPSIPPDSITQALREARIIQ